MGYLKCEKCDGYYELQEGESPDDFEKTCECGGKLKYVESLDSFSDESEDLEESGKLEENQEIPENVEKLEQKTPKNDNVPLSQDKTIDKPIFNSKDLSQGHFCPKCGTRNTQTATFCKKCGYDFKTGEIPSKNISYPLTAKNSSNDDKKSLKSKITNKKVLIPLVLVLLVLVAVGGYFLYQNYVNQTRMQEMDKNMVQYHSLMAPVSAKYDQTNQLANSTSPNYDQIYSNIDSMIADSKQAKSYAETAYQYSDGPYKDYLNQWIKYTDLYISSLGLWKQRVQYIQQNNLYLVTETKKSEDTVSSEMTKLSNEMSTFTSTHPEVKQHANQNWDFNIQ